MFFLGVRAEAEQVQRQWGSQESDCPQDPKRLVAPTVNPSLLSSLEESQYTKKRTSLFVVSRDHFFCFSSFMLTEVSHLTIAWQLRTQQ